MNSAMYPNDTIAVTSPSKFALSVVEIHAKYAKNHALSKSSCQNVKDVIHGPIKTICCLSTVVKDTTAQSV